MAAFLASIVIAVAFLMTHPAPVAAQTTSPNATAEAIRYTVSFPAPHTHYAEVSVVVPTSRRPSAELMMAVWTPGSYLIREFERNVESVTASAPDGRSLDVEKSGKNRWRVNTGNVPAITVKSRVYGREMSVRTNWIDAGFALLNGAPTFMTLADGVSRPHEVTIVPAQGWKRSMTGLAPMAGSDHHYRAADYDVLVDSPIVIGNPVVHEFVVDGKTHYLVNEGEAGVFDGARAARDLAMIVQRVPPHVGLSAIRQVSVPESADRGVRWTRAQELLRPDGQSLGHPHAPRLPGVARARQPRARARVEREASAASGAWSFQLRRGGAHAQPLGCRRHHRLLRRSGGAPGRASRRARSSSIRSPARSTSCRRRLDVSCSPRSSRPSTRGSSPYRPDENSANTSISYYTKGAVLGFLLDAKIRNATGGARSLDDVLTTAYQRYAGDRGYTPAEFRAVAEQVAGVSLSAFWATGVEGTGELDYSEALETFGLRFRSSAQPAGRPWLGMTTRNDAGRLLVSQVRRDSPAEAAGLNVDDEVIAIDEFRVRADRFESRLEQYRPGDRISVLLARRDQLLRLDVTVGTEPARAWRLDINPMAPERATQARNRWLPPPRPQ